MLYLLDFVTALYRNMTQNVIIRSQMLLDLEWYKILSGAA